MNISVIIPTRNEPTVFDAVESALAQGYEDFEVIVVDGSTGKHREELEAFCDEHDVRYAHQNEQDEAYVGLNGARNLGVELADGDAVALLDGDCVARPDWLSSLADAFDAHDIVECNVTYQNNGKKCPMDRTVENDGKQYRFLGAGLAFKKEVWDAGAFDERFVKLRNDTAFGLTALDNGFDYGFVEDAVVEHHSGRFAPTQFVKERLRFVEEPLFYKEFKDHSHFTDNALNIGPLLYPEELLYLAALTLSFFMQYNYVAVPALLLFGEGMYLRREATKRDLDSCPKDLVLLFVLTPLALLAKRYAIWRGAVNHRVVVL